MRSMGEDDIDRVTKQKGSHDMESTPTEFEFGCPFLIVVENIRES